MLHAQDLMQPDLVCLASCWTVAYTSAVFQLRDTDTFAVLLYNFCSSAPALPRPAPPALTYPGLLHSKLLLASEHATSWRQCTLIHTRAYHPAVPGL